MPDAGTPAQTPVPPAAPAPEPFALDLLQRQDFAQRRDARNFLEQYLWLGCRMGGMAGFVGVCVGVSVGVSVRASRARAGAGCVCACGRCACVRVWVLGVCLCVRVWVLGVCLCVRVLDQSVCVCLCVRVCVWLLC